MTEKQPYQHRSDVVGSRSAEGNAETEHRDAARPSGEERNELDPEQRNRQDGYGPRTHQDTRIDPDPRFEEDAGA
jgi:hypothetical protein